MASKGTIWKCDICGQVIEVKEEGGGELVCCESPMTMLEGQEAAQYK